MDVDEEQNNDYDNGEIESTQPKKTGSASSSNKVKFRTSYLSWYCVFECIRNLSPCFECENIMVTESNLAKLANFGTSREKHDATTTIGSQPERVRWLAPEKLKDNGRRYDHKCEIFSFGMNWLLVKIHTKILISDHVIAGGREIFPTHGTIEVMKRSLYKFKVYKIMYVSQLVTEDNRLKVWSQVTYGKNEECGVQEESGT
ncbi:hypothetical protein RhiirB3_509498 [Rhizophagus irregularis]|nr:hypothetical protein RhiirB3_509498 [Rhizophagus irregularis]